MKIVVAMDSFKGSLSSMEAGMAVAAGIYEADAGTDVIIKPLADGGEGTTEALIEGLGGEEVCLEVKGPLGESVKASYGMLKKTKTAIMEMAKAAGLALTDGKRDLLKATTFGVGEMIRDAALKGSRNFLIGIGGSATNDGGIGMLTALGFNFLDKDGNDAGIDAEALKKVVSVETQNVLPEIWECHFQIACDVTNPLCGENGSSFVFGPQKGASIELCGTLDGMLEHFAEVTKRCTGTNYKNTPGAGAAGGLGFAFLSYLHADLQPGADLVLKAVKMEENLKDADFLITGEGCLDGQTVMGKAPYRVAGLAKKYGVKVVALAGSILKDASQCNAEGIDAIFSILQKPIGLKEAMDPVTAKENMSRTAQQVMRLILASKSRVP